MTFDPSGSLKVKFDGAKLGAGLQQAPLRHPAKFQPDRTNGLRDVRYRNLSLFSKYFKPKDFDVDFDPSGSSKVKFGGAKLGAGLQQAPLRHPAKFQPDRANGLRDVRYQFFHFLTLGADPWGKVHQTGR